jgi:signal transduction histidine kinase
VLFRSIADGVTDGNSESQDALATILKFVTAAGFASLVALIGAAAHIIGRFVRELQEAWQASDIANQSLEEKVRERTRDLMAANEEIRRFAHIVTHDLRAPLVNIMGFTSELSKDADILREQAAAVSSEPEDQQRIRQILDEDLPESVGFIRASTTKMDGLINAILRISRDGQRVLKSERIDLEGLARHASDAVHHQVADASGRIEIDVSPIVIQSDRMSLEQILGNLLDNAVKYRDPDRQLRIFIRARELSRTHFEISVSDNGRGIDPKDHERIFDLFRRAGRQTAPGEGIGLAHLRSLVRNLGGEVKVESSPGQGATFVVRLPKILANIQRKIGRAHV